MEIFIAIVVWVLESAFLLALLHLGIPTVVNAMTMNSWVKLPVMVVIGILAGILMALMHYIPYYLFFIWIALTWRMLPRLFKPEFEEKYGLKLRKPVFYVSTYSYIIVACLTAFFFQGEVMLSDSPNVWIPLWRSLLK